MNRRVDLPEGFVPRRGAYRMRDIAGIVVGGLLLLLLAGIIVYGISLEGVFVGG